MNFKSVPKKILFLAFVLFFLNLFDAGATTFLLTSGVITEGNPIMAWLLEQGMWAFWALKMSLGTIVPCVFVKTHKHAVTRAGLWISVGVYALVFAYHIFLLFHCF